MPTSQQLLLTPSVLRSADVLFRPTDCGSVLTAPISGQTLMMMIGALEKYSMHDNETLLNRFLRGTARRANRVLAIVILSVRPSVCNDTVPIEVQVR